jgi:hypothetical protein
MSDGFQVRTARRRGGGRRGALALLVPLCLGALADGDVAQARVNPLMTISQQIEKANILLVVDTSGSMLGVPGGNFTANTEVGADCESGDRCRTVPNAAMCSDSGLPCSKDGDCRQGRCEDGGDPCLDDADCAQSSGTCSASGSACQYNADCAPSSGTCSQGGSCSSVNPCPAINVCQYNDQSCSTLGSACGVTCAGTTLACSSGLTCVNANVGDAAPYQVNNLIARWEFNNNLNAVVSAACYTAGASAINYTTDRNGTASGAYQHNAADTGLVYADSPNDFNLITSSSGMSAAAWVKWTSFADVTGKTSYGAILSRVMRAATTVNWELVLKSVSGVQSICVRQDRSAPAQELCWDATALLATGSWYHVGFTWSGGTATIYVNGLARTSGALSLNPVTDNGVIGILTSFDSWSSSGNNIPTQGLAGAIDDVRIYTRGLTTAEVRQISRLCPPANTCVGGPGNACSVGLNVCTAGTSNRCTGQSTTATCTSGGNGSGPMKMCQLGLETCVLDSQCKISGDVCVPATSRAVMAKRALSSVLYRNKDLVNFGMMTFTQSGYFPYYPASSLITVNQTDLLRNDFLVHVGCMGATPAATCVSGGRTYSLVASNNSRYRVHSAADEYITVNQNFCGSTCNTSQGLGIYEGSYYQFSVPSGTYDPRATPIVKSTYQGKVLTQNGTNYVYFEPLTNYNADPESGTNRPAIKADINCGGRDPCSATCGGRWDTQLSPFLDPTGVSSTANVNAIAANFQKAWLGGLMFWGRTPIGCALKNNGAPDEGHSAYHYIQKLKGIDNLGCRRNYVLLVTDGEPNGPGDIDTYGKGICNTAACASDDPEGNGCKCRSVLSAQALRRDLGVNTYVVTFGGDAAAGSGKAVNDNVARAGGTGIASIAFNEFQLANALQAAILDAVKGSYATAPPTASSGVQQSSGVQTGRLVLDARVDFPSWAGHLHAYDTDSGLSWDAATVAFNASSNPNFWRERRVWTWNGTQMVRVAVDGSGAATNRAALRALGLGATDAETDRAVRWLLGDPAMKNPAVLGALINSTPIDVGPVGSSPLPGGKRFYEAYKERPNLIYVGSDDGMLHAFFTRDTVLAGVTYRGGSEAFAFIPPEMLPVITKVYAAGGQYPAPTDHVFGLASSPKVKNMCVANCADNATAVWKTVLYMGDGPGGSEGFALDITDVFDAGGVAGPPVRMLWHTQFVTESSRYDDLLGQTFSVPAFYFGKTSSLDDQRMLMTSGYGSGGNQGRAIISASAQDGHIIDAQTLAPGNGCTVEYAALTDVATARNYSVDEKQQILAGYFGDTWGNLWRYVPAVGSDGITLPTGTISPVTTPGCDQPLHFAPAVVQLDRDFPTSQSGAIYLVQVTNSPLDPDTKGFGPSRLIVRKDLASGGSVLPDLTFGGSGSLTLQVGTSQICTGSPCLPLPSNARPLSTPTVIIKQAGQSFLVFTVWYVPGTCSKGQSYLTVHEVTATQVIQRSGQVLAAEPVTGIVVAGLKLYYIDSTMGLRELTSQQTGLTFNESGRLMGAGAAERLRKLAWTEIP